MKRFIAIFGVVLVMVLTMLPFTVCANDTEYVYELWGSGVMIDSYNGLDNNVVMPNTLLVDGKSYDVVKINERAFANSTISSIVFPDNLTTIGAEAFYNCRNLLYLSFTDKLENIAPGAFNGCDNLTSVTFPKSVNNIQDASFINCTKLQSAYFMGNKPETMFEHIFDNTAKGFIIYYTSQYSYSWNDYTEYPTMVLDGVLPVPEIPSFVLLGIGISCLGLFIRYKAKYMATHIN